MRFLTPQEVVQLEKLERKARSTYYEWLKWCDEHQTDSRPMKELRETISQSNKAWAFGVVKQIQGV